MTHVYIVAGARTAFTEFGGSFAETDAAELGKMTATAALKRAGVRGEQIDHVIYGNVIHTSENAAYLARHIGLKAGVPEQIPALTLNRLCGSGAQAVVTAVQQILLNEAEIILAGGAENMSMAPFANFSLRFRPPKMGDVKYVDMLTATLTDQYIGSGMGMTAEKLAEQYGISREEQDAFALASHRRAHKAQETGIFTEEITPVEIKTKRGTQTIARDEQIRADTSLDKLAQLRPAFINDGTVTAGNASGINDGAVSLIVASEKAVEKNNLQPLCRIVSWGVVGVDPSIMGIGPVPAMKQALERAQLTLDDMDLIEVNEAFAAQYLAVERALHLDRSKTNVNGGAIALGHPVGASGARLLLTLAYELRRRKGKYGIASLCIGGGQGIAVVIENV